MIDYCLYENTTTFIGIKKKIVPSWFSSTGAFASPEYELNFFEQKNDSEQEVKEINEVDEIEYNHSMKVLNSFAELERGWDGYDAEPISSTSIGVTERLLSAMSIVPGLIVGWDVSPTGRGTVQIEKTTANGYFEIELFADGLFSCYGERSGEKFSVDLKSVDDAVKWVIDVVS
ncbi:MAG: hypothetical protein HUK20_09795 [Fibrobacter sp.]|nr:hypothetical protein [Fibrobacter sp.]